MNHVKTIASRQGIGKGSRNSCASRQRGFALIVSLMILVVLTLVAVTALRSSIVEEQVSGNQKMAATALFGAEQGVSQALSEMFDGTISDTGSESDSSWSHSGSTSGTGYSANYCVRHLLVGENDDTCPPSITGTTPVEDDDGRRYFIIDSVGETYAGSGTGQVVESERTLEVGVALEWGGGSNVAGLIGCQGVTGLSNFATGSYSSTDQESDGDRGDVATTDAGAFMYIDSNPDIFGEIRSTGAIYLNSNPIVRRDALANLRITVETGDIYGSAYTNDTCYSCDGDVHGSIYQGPSVTPNPLVPLPDCDPLDINAIFSAASVIKTTNNNTNIGLSSGDDYEGSPSTLPAGDYYFTNFTLEGNEIVTVNGDVRIFVYNDFTMKSNPELILGAGASLKIYVETGNAWIDSAAKVNHDPSNFFPSCYHPDDVDDKNNSPPGGCPRNVWLYSKLANSVKDHKVTSNYDEPNVWETSVDIAGVVINSNSIFFGIVYAPLSHVVLGSNVQAYGSIRGRFVTGDSNFNFSYDEDLDDLWTGNPTDYKLVYWTEKYPE